MPPSPVERAVEELATYEPALDDERGITAIMEEEPRALGPGDWLRRADVLAAVRSLPPDPVVEAAQTFLHCSQAIERRGDSGVMEEYEDAWHELQAALTTYQEEKD